MMVFTQEGVVQVLWNNIIGFPTGTPFRTHLIGLPITPTHARRMVDYSAVELAVAGYAPRAWSANPTDYVVSNTAYGGQVLVPTFSWTFTGACTVWGYWISDVADAYAIWGELFPTTFGYGPSGGGFSLVLPPNLISCPFPEPLCPD